MPGVNRGGGGEGGIGLPGGKGGGGVGQARPIQHACSKYINIYRVDKWCML